MDRVALRSAWCLGFSIASAVCAVSSWAQGADTVVVSAERETAVPENTPAPTFGIDASQLQSLTVVNAEDALKYAPNLHVRKRYIGDNNGVVSVRSTSSRQSARTLVYADGLLLSNFLGSDFGFPPRWSMVSAEEVERVDVLYGPYSARFPGNSLGATVLISTAMPHHFEAAASVQYFNQSFDLYGADQSFDGHKLSGWVGNRTGPWSYVLSVERLDTEGQPLSFLTAVRSASPAGPTDVPVTGAVPYVDQAGRQGYVLGINSEGFTETVNDQVKLKVAYDLAPDLQLAFTAVRWRQDITNATSSFLARVDGSAVSSGNVAIDGNRYTLAGNAFAPGDSESRRRLFGLTLRSRNEQGWSYSVIASRFETARDIARTASGVGEGPGTILFGDGSGWTTLDVHADYKPMAGSHWIAFGLHGDRYELDNRTFDTGDWLRGAPTAFNNAFAGRTETAAAYVQDTWAFASNWKLIPGVRFERWRATDGVRRQLEAAQPSDGTPQREVVAPFPARSDSFASPKLALERSFQGRWTARLSLARACRLPTVSELFQGRITGTTLVNNDPNLQPEKAFSKDLTIERTLAHARLRASIYEDDIRDALFSQTNTTVFPNITNIQNVDRVRTRGVEIAIDTRDFPLDRLDVQASVAHNHSRILENDNNPVSVGKHFYRIPDWRADVASTYRVTRWLSSTLAARYSGRQYNTLDNTDINPDTFGGTSRYFVVDTKLSLTPRERLSLGLGVENLTDERYFVFHPYPGRTYYAEAKLGF